jgi:hypothetical protein
VPHYIANVFASRWHQREKFFLKAKTDLFTSILYATLSHAKMLGRIALRGIRVLIEKLNKSFFCYPRFRPWTFFIFAVSYDQKLLILIVDRLPVYDFFHR